MPNHETTVFEEPEVFDRSEHLDTQPDVEQPEARPGRLVEFPNLRNLARAGMVGLGLAVGVGGAAESATAHSAVRDASPSGESAPSFSKAEERKAERSVKRMLIEGRKPPVYKGIVEWKNTDTNDTDSAYKTKLPIVTKVRQKDGKRTDRYFEVLPGGISKSEIIVRAISPDARKISTANSQLDGKVSRYAVKFNKEYAPTITQRTSGKKAKARNMPIGETTISTGWGYEAYLSTGKRYAEQIETVRRLEGVKNLEEFKGVMQNYLDQYKIKLNIAPEEVIQKPGSYTIEYLKESELPAARKFGLAVVDEMAKYPKGFPTEIGIKQMDLVSSGKRTGENTFAALANVQDQRVVFTVKSSNDTVQHETIHFAAINALNMRDNDTVWQSFNPPGFRYTGYTSLCEGDDIVCGRGVNKSSWPGFASKYSEANVDEDIAETGTLVMCDGYDNLKRIAKKDPILGNKIAYFISRMGQRFPFFTERYLSNINPTQSCNLEK